MKKEYLRPESLLISVMTQGILQNSVLTGKESEDSFNVSTSQEEYDGSGASRRGRNQWEDDEDGY